MPRIMPAPEMRRAPCRVLGYGWVMGGSWVGLGWVGVIVGVEGQSIVARGCTSTVGCAEQD